MIGSGSGFMLELILKNLIEN